MEINPTYSSLRRSGQVRDPLEFLVQQGNRSLGQRVLGEVADSARELGQGGKKVLSKFRDLLPKQTPTPAPLTKGQRELEAFRKFKAGQVQSQVAADQAAGKKAMDAFQKGKGVKVMANSPRFNGMTAGGLVNGLKTLGLGFLADLAVPHIAREAVRGGLVVTGQDTTNFDRRNAGLPVVVSLDGVSYNTSTAEGMKGALEAKAKGAKPTVSGDIAVALSQLESAGIGNENNRYIEVTGADGKPVRLDMNNPADVERLQKIQPKGAINPSLNDGLDLRGPSHKDLLTKFNDNEDAAEAEGMRIWAEKFGDLAAKVKPGQAGYEVIQDVLNTDNTGAAISPFAQAFADKKVGEMFTDNRFADTFTNSINLQNPLQGFELDAAAPYSNADLGDIDFLTASQMPSLLTAPGQSFEIPQAVIEKAKAMPFDRDDPTKEDPEYARLRDAQISNYMATRTTKPVFDEATQSWKQVPISR